MPQRKLIKRAKKTKKISTDKYSIKQNILTLITKIESEFRHVPNKLVALCRQEQEKLKHQKNKIITAQKKASDQQNILHKKQAISATKKTTALKKQMTKIKKSILEQTKLIKSLEKQKQTIVKTEILLANKKEKFTVLGKELIQIEKKLKAKKPTASTKKKNSKQSIKKIQPKQIAINKSSPRDSMYHSSLEFTSTDFPTRESN